MRREGAQVKAAEAGRRGSVGHVEVFRMDGVGTSIVGRPRRLPVDRRARRPTPSSGKSHRGGIPRRSSEEGRLVHHRNADRDSVLT
ncbi:hypothetical protein E4A41_00130 [Micrococcus endophyticus]|nr:hypothetical protein E4A41_00130 [Micrococcus endophyticus]